MKTRVAEVLTACVLVSASAGFLTLSRVGAVQTPPPAAQNPSPMVENTRAHERLPRRELPGVRRSLDNILARSVQLFIPQGALLSDALRLVIHFHGEAYVVEQAVADIGQDHVAAVVNLGAGSRVYQQAFAAPAVYDSLLVAVTHAASDAMRRPVRITHTALVGFSAGYGAIRAILSDSSHFDRIDAVLLLDGLHASYVPEGTVIAKGGAIDSTVLDVFVKFARAAVRGDKRFVVTHSEVFPGTFASTTETTDWLLRTLGVSRRPVLEWGPVGMQQLSVANSGRFEVLGFAGNSAPDHIDQLHGLPTFLRRLELK